MSSTSSRSRQKKTPVARYLLIGMAVLALIAAYFLFGPNTGTFTEGDYLYIHTGSDYKSVQQALRAGGFIRDMKSFDFVAERAGYPGKVRPGKYHITRGMSNYSIVRMLRSGRQTPVRLVITKLRTKQEFMHLVSSNLEADSATLRHMLADTNYLAQFGLDTATALCAVMPDTYEFYWNTGADKAFRKIEKDYVHFWSAGRLAAAQRQELTPQQAMIVASIVEEESNKNDEKPMIASVYLNRLRQGIKLQADPTARYAYGDFTIRRITSVQTGIISPYNTYQVTGLPVGPICTPSQATIDAVIHAPKTTYLYFCAREDGSGYHRFATTYAEHLKNASLYHTRLNEENVH